MTKTLRTKRALMWSAAFAAIHGFLIATLAQGTLVHVTFDPNLSAVGVRNYQESGVSFSAMTNQAGYSGFSRIPARYYEFGYPYNGTAYIQGSPFAPVVVTLAEAGVFGLFSIDLAEHNLTTPNALTVQFVGYFADGSSVLSSFTTDGLIRVPGTPDFQTFYFGPEFRWGLTRVEILPTGGSLDNLAVFIPEPSAPVLCLLGAAALWGCRPPRPGRRNPVRQQRFHSFLGKLPQAGAGSGRSAGFPTGFAGGENDDVRSLQAAPKNRNPKPVANRRSCAGERTWTAG